MLTFSKGVRAENDCPHRNNFEPCLVTSAVSQVSVVLFVLSYINELPKLVACNINTSLQEQP